VKLTVKARRDEPSALQVEEVFLVKPFLRPSIGRVLVRGVSVPLTLTRPAFYAFFFLPGLVAARTFRAFSISRVDQSRILAPPIFCNGGASTVLAETCLCRVRMVTPSFLAASRVESRSFMYNPVSYFDKKNKWYSLNLTKVS
jgi:hypothetical protein